MRTCHKNGRTEGGGGGASLEGARRARAGREEAKKAGERKATREREAERRLWRKRRRVEGGGWAWEETSEGA
jgi:hypothetical protein